MDKIAFVSGGTGFLGINLIRELLKKDWKVFALHRPSSSLKYLKNLEIQLIPGDITDIDSLRNGIPENPDAIFHVAASTNLWAKNNDSQTKINVEGTENMVKVALEKKAKRFIHTSSIAAYGFHHGVIDENTPSNAMDSNINYFITKFQAEEIIKKATAEKGLDAVILNPCHIMGPFDQHNWVQLIQTVYHNNLPGIPPANGWFCHVEEVAKAHISAFENGVTGENYIMAGEKNSFKRVVNILQEKFNQKISQQVTPAFLLKIALWKDTLVSWINKNEPLLTPEKYQLLLEDLEADDSKAKENLGFKKIPVDQILEDSIKWLKKENLL